MHVKINRLNKQIELR